MPDNENVKAVRDPARQGRVLIQRWGGLMVVSAVATVLSIRYVDRPVADFCESRYRETDLWQWLNHLLTPFPLVVVAAFFSLFVAGYAALAGKRLASWTATPLRCSWATMWALAAERILKSIFGRQGPDPMYLRFHKYGFNWMHGNVRWSSFPSGTAIVAFAITSVLWTEKPRMRLPSLAVTLLLLVAVVLTNWHWVSDVIAGSFLGSCIGSMTIRLMPPGDTMKYMSSHDTENMAFANNAIVQDHMKER